MGCGAKLANQRNTAWLGTALFFGLHDERAANGRAVALGA